MNNLIRKALLVISLATATGLASADDRFESRAGFSSGGDLEWRLGDFRGDRLGYQVLYRADGDRRWRVAPGGAVDVADGWVLGTDRHRGGHGIYRWNGRDWSRMPGTAVRIGGSYRQPWVVNDRDIRFVWTGYAWREDGRGGNDRRERDDRNDRRDRGERDDRNDRRDRD